MGTFMQGVSKRGFIRVNTKRKLQLFFAVSLSLSFFLVGAKNWIFSSKIRARRLIFTRIVCYAHTLYVVMKGCRINERNAHVEHVSWQCTTRRRLFDFYLRATWFQSFRVANRGSSLRDITRRFSYGDRSFFRPFSSPKLTFTSLRNCDFRRKRPRGASRKFMSDLRKVSSKNST